MKRFYYSLIFSIFLLLLFVPKAYANSEPDIEQGQLFITGNSAPYISLDILFYYQKNSDLFNVSPQMYFSATEDYQAESGTEPVYNTFSVTDGTNMLCHGGESCSNLDIPDGWYTISISADFDPDHNDVIGDCIAIVEGGLPTCWIKSSLLVAGDSFIDQDTWSWRYDSPYYAGDFPTPTPTPTGDVVYWTTSNTQIPTELRNTFVNASGSAVGGMATVIPIGLGVVITTALLFNGVQWFRHIAGLNPPKSPEMFVSGEDSGFTEGYFDAWDKGEAEAGNQNADYIKGYSAGISAREDYESLGKMRKDTDKFLEDEGKAHKNMREAIEKIGK